jgi:hypothetical protein
MVEDPESPPPRRSRLEDEVLEILYRSDRPTSFSDRLRAASRRAGSSLRVRRSFGVGEFVSRLDAGMWLAVWVGLGIVAYVVRDASPLLARILAVVCLAMIVFAIVRSFGRPGRGSIKRWRGRDIDISPPSRPLWIDKVFRGQRRPPRRYRPTRRRVGRITSW